MKFLRLSQTNNPTSVDIQGTTLTVYHRTKSADIADSIATVGFMAGSGAAYGVGIYSTYDLNSSMQNSNLFAYGGEVLRGKVNINGFLIFDYDIAKQVYGANYKLIDQIQHIIGEDKIFNPALDKDAQIKDLKYASERLESTEMTSDVANNLSRKFKLDQTGLKGIIFTGRNDGKVCVAYKEILVIPEAHAWIDGKTWKNPNWEPLGYKSKEEIEKLKDNDEKYENFSRERKQLLKVLGYAKDRGPINISPNQFPNIPESIFESALANFLYEDVSRIERLNPELRTRMKDIIEVDFVLRKIKSAPTVHWSEYKKLSPEIKAKIPDEVLIDIWENFAKKNPGYWSYIPDSIRNAIPKENEVKYWEKIIRKNPANWKHAHPEIVEVLASETDLVPPNNLDELRNDEKSNEVSETEEIDVPSSALGWVQENIAKLNKRAAQLGLRPIVHEVISEDPKTRTQRIKIIGNVPYIKGWKLIAKVSDITDEDGNTERVVETLSDEGIPSGLDLENTKMRCDDCGYNHERTTCYIVKNESSTTPHGKKQQVYNIGDTLMIGSACLKKFIGHIESDTNPESIAKYAQLMKQTLSAFKEENQYKDKSDDQIRKDFKKTGVPLAFFLSKVMQLNRKFGYLSVNQARNQGKSPTAPLAWQMCVDLATDQKYSDGVEASDMATIYSAINWINNLPEEESNGFLQKVQNISKAGTVLNTRKNSQIYLASWVVPAYQKQLEDKIDYTKVIGTPEEETVFKGEVIGKRPVLVQVSQQVSQGKNLTENYFLAQGEGRTVAWLEKSPIKAGLKDTVYIKGKVESIVPIGNVSSTILKDVQEISEQEYDNARPYIEKRLKELASKEIENEEENQESDLNVPGSPKGNYVNGDVIVEKFVIEAITDSRYSKRVVLKDPYGKMVSAFTNNNLGQVGDTVILTGVVKINGQWINLDNPNVYVGSLDNAPQPVSAYVDGEAVEDDFKVNLATTDPRWRGYLHRLTDSHGRDVSYWSSNQTFRQGETVHLTGTIKIKNGYVNITRIKITPSQAQKPSQIPNPAQRPQTNQQLTNALPLQPQGTQPAPNADGDGVTASAINFHKTGSTRDNLKTSSNWYKINIDVERALRFALSQPEPEETPPDQFEDDVAPDVTPDVNVEKPKYREPHEVDLDRAYDMFSESYQKATGKTWGKGKFLNRSAHWRFYGDDNGYIVVRPQNSGLYKLVGIAGDDSNPMAKAKSLLNGFNDLMSEGKPVWGMVSSDLKSMAERMGMKSPSPMLIKAFIRHIPISVFGGATINNVMPDGGVEFEYSDIGKATKYFIANNQYYDWLKESIDSNQNIPRPARFLVKKLLGKLAKSEALIKTASVSSFDGVKNYIDIFEV